MRGFTHYSDKGFESGLKKRVLILVHISRAESVVVGKDGHFASIVREQCEREMDADAHRLLFIRSEMPPTERCCPVSVGIPTSINSV